MGKDLHCLSETSLHWLLGTSEHSSLSTVSHCLSLTSWHCSLGTSLHHNNNNNTKQ